MKEHLLLKYSVSWYFEFTNTKFLHILRCYEIPKSKISKYFLTKIFSHIIAKHAENISFPMTEDVGCVFSFHMFFGRKVHDQVGHTGALFYVCGGKPVLRGKGNRSSPHVLFGGLINKWACPFLGPSINSKSPTSTWHDHPCDYEVAYDSLCKGPARNWKMILHPSYLTFASLSFAKITVSGY